MIASKKKGRPRKTENRERMTKISFKADEVTRVALAQLKNTLVFSGTATGGGIHYLRPKYLEQSEIIRQAILTAARVGIIVSQEVK